MQHPSYVFDLLHASPHAVFLLDLSGKIVFANKMGAKRLGKTSEEMIGTTLRDYFPPDISERRRQIGMEALRSGNPQRFTDRVDDRWYHSTILPIKDEKGNPTHLAIYSDDITERMRTLEALRESEERYRLFVESANEGIILIQEGKLKYMNPRALEFIGYSEKEMQQRHFFESIHPDDQNGVMALYAAKIRGEEVPPGMSYRIIDNNGTVKWVQSRSTLLKWEGAPALLTFMTDITQQKQLESHMHRTQKMEAIGTLAGGIAHDFNNLLMGIQGNVSLMLMDLDSGSPHYGKLESIEQYVQNGAMLTKQLLGLSRGGKYEVKSTDINTLVKESATMFGRTRKEIKIHQKRQPDLWSVEVDQGQIGQVLLNIYVNAWQAMPGGGELFIQTENVVLDRDYVSAFDVEPGRHVKISVTDTGSGMDEATLQRVFDPFFTTKEMGRGTGLGLASAYGIVKNHRGIINVYSEKGQGTTFNIYLPASDKTIEKGKATDDAIEKGSETVLLVDDEEMIITVGEQLLTRLGYQVMTARSGKEAIERYRASRDRIDLIILDMVMPDMGGAETYDRLKKVNPAVKVLLASGYSLNGTAQSILDLGCDAFIQKPFNLKKLSRQVRSVLDNQ